MEDDNRLTLEQALVAADKIRSVDIIPEHRATRDCVYLKVNGMCYICCEVCNLDNHRCLGCGTELNHNGYEYIPRGGRIKHNPPGEKGCYE